MATADPKKEKKKRKKKWQHLSFAVLTADREHGL